MSNSFNDPDHDRTAIVQLPGHVLEPLQRTPRLLIVSGLMLGRQVHLRAGETVTVGRAAEATIYLPYPNVSRMHCRIERVGDDVFIEDAGSTNRTSVNDAPISERTRLNDGDQIGVGSSAMKFFIGATAQASYHEELMRLATYDALTNLYNRGHFSKIMDEECARVARERSPLALIMLDIDFFKRVNDELGHAAGDQVLRMVASTIQQAIKPSMLAGRLGGEEFAVLCRNCTVNQAAAFAEQLRSAVAAIDFAQASHSRKITASFGVAAWQAQFKTATELMKTADEALYRAKQGGRNRVCAATGL